MPHKESQISVYELHFLKLENFKLYKLYFNKAIKNMYNTHIQMLIADILYSTTIT